MSDASKRWDAVMKIIEIKEPKLFSYLAHGRFKDDSGVNVTLVVSSDADADEVKKGVRVYEAEIDLCTSTVYGEKRGVKVAVSPEQFAAAPPLLGTAPAEAPAPSVASPTRPVETAPAPQSAPPSDPAARMEAEVRAQVEAEFRAKLDEEVRRRMEAKLREEQEREEARRRALQAERDRRLGLLAQCEQLSGALAARLAEMKASADPVAPGDRLSALLADAHKILSETSGLLAQLERRTDAPAS